jgi:hypothetical protein
MALGFVRSPNEDRCVYNLDTTRKNRLVRVLSIAYVCLAGVVFLSTRCLRARRRASGTWRARRARRTSRTSRTRRPRRARGRLLRVWSVARASAQAPRLPSWLGRGQQLLSVRNGARGGNGNDFNLPEIFRHWTIPGVLCGQ